MAIKFKDIEMPMDDALKHAMMATQEHQNIQQAQYEIMGEVNTLRGLLEKQDPNSESYKTTLNMIQDLDSAAKNLASNGLQGAASRDNLYGLKNKYQQNITPISQAYDARLKALSAEKEALAKDPSLMIENGGYNSTSVDDWVKNPGLNLRRYSGSQLTAEVSTAAKNLAGKFINGQNAIELRSLVGGDYYAFIQRKGFSPEAIYQAILESPNASPVLQGIVNNAMEASGVNAWASEEQIEQLKERAKQGLYSAMGEDSANIVQNWRAQEEAKAAAKKPEDIQEPWLEETESLADKSEYNEAYDILQEAAEGSHWGDALMDGIVGGVGSAAARSITGGQQLNPPTNPHINSNTNYWTTDKESYEENLGHLSQSQRDWLKEKYDVKTRTEAVEKGLLIKDEETGEYRVNPDFDKNKLITQRTVGLAITPEKRKEYHEALWRNVTRNSGDDWSGRVYDLSDHRGAEAIEWKDGTFSDEIDETTLPENVIVPSFERMKDFNGKFIPMVVLQLNNGREIGVHPNLIGRANLTNRMMQYYQMYEDAKAQGDERKKHAIQNALANLIRNNVYYGYNKSMSATDSKL